MVKILLAVMAGIIALGLLLSHAPGAEARTLKHRSWKGYTVCYSKHWKRAHPHRARCHRHKSRELRMRLRAVRYARSKVGHWYSWGAVGPNVFDCSGLMYAAWHHAGRRIPRTTYSELAGMRHGHHRRARVGDLLLPSSHHVGMYVGHNRVIHAPHTGSRIQYASASRFRVYRRSPLG